MEYTLFNLFILELKVSCHPDKIYGRSKLGQYDKEKNRAPSTNYIQGNMLGYTKMCQKYSTKIRKHRLFTKLDSGKHAVT